MSFQHTGLHASRILMAIQGCRAVAMRFNYSRLLLDLGEKGVYSSYTHAEDNSPYAKWFDRLNVTAAVKVTTAVHRMEQGNFSNVKGVGAGIYDRKAL